MEGDGNDETLIQQDFDSLLSQYKKDHFQKESSKDLNLYFLHFLNSTDKSPERPRQCYDQEMDYHQENIAEVFACIHQNFDERVCELLINSVPSSSCCGCLNNVCGCLSCIWEKIKKSFIWISDKIINCFTWIIEKIRKCFPCTEKIMQCFNWISEKIIHSANYFHWFKSFFLSWLSLYAIYFDVTKDIVLTCSIFFLVGGVSSLIQVPFYFTSVVVIYFFCSIFIPLIISSIHLACSYPGLIFGKLESEKTPFTFFKRATYCASVFVFTPINAILLEDQHEKLKQQEKYFSEIKNYNKLAQVLKKRKKVTKAIVKFQKIELATEAFLEAPAQILLLLLANTNTPTTGGLETVFKTATFLGIRNTYVCLLSSVFLSLKTCIESQATEIITEKPFLPLSSKVMIYIWGFFATVRRIMGLVAFFIPSFGLFNILYHWEAEQTPYQARLTYASQKTYLPNDQIYLYNMTETIYWSEIDRWDYSSDPPTPPPYTLYTGLSLLESFLGTIGLSLAHCVLVYIFKCALVQNFRKEKLINRIIHVLENMNISIPFKDWDNVDTKIKEENQDTNFENEKDQKYDRSTRMTVHDFKTNFEAVKREMLGCYFITFIFMVVQLIPLWFTCKQDTKHIISKLLEALAFIKCHLR